MIATRPKVIFTWTPMPKQPKADRGGFSDHMNDAGVRQWAEQIITAYRYGRNPDVLYEIWVDGNEMERQVATRLMREYGDAVN